jgi:hypothetical protein
MLKLESERSVIVDAFPQVSGGRLPLLLVLPLVGVATQQCPPP